MTLQGPVSRKTPAVTSSTPAVNKIRELAEASRENMSRGQLFWAFLIVPTLIASLYYGLIASDRYVSEADFVVRGVSNRRASGLEMFFQTFGIARTVDDANAVQSYIMSRDALRALEKKIDVREIFHGKNADVFSRFPRFWRSDSFESLYDYYLERVTVVQESSKGIAQLRVEAFSPGDAQKIARELLTLGEQLVNRLNTRAQEDELLAQGQ